MLVSRDSAEGLWRGKAHGRRRREGDARRQSRGLDRAYNRLRANDASIALRLWRRQKVGHGISSQGHRPVQTVATLVVDPSILSPACSRKSTLKNQHWTMIDLSAGWLRLR